jgi:BON domain
MDRSFVMKARVSLHLAAAALLVFVGITTGCAKKPNDAQITSAIQSNFQNDSGLQDKQIGVQSAGGVVTLSGNVDNETQRAAAARYASAAPGVKEVVNNLQVGAPAESAQAQPEQMSQPEPAAAPAPTPKPKPSRHHRHVVRTSDDSDSMPSSSSNSTQMAQAEPAQDAPMAPAPIAAAPAPPPPPPPPQKVTVPSGTTLAIRLTDPIDSETAQQGQTFHATLESPLAVDGEVVIPAGYDVEGHVVSVQSAGKFAGKSELTLQLDRIAVGSRYYNIQTDQYHREGSSRGKNTAEKVGAGSVIGAIIGGIAGGGKGAAIGAAAGGGLGGGVQAATKGQQIKLPSETVLNFTLQQPVTVLPTTKGPNSGRQRLDTNQ